MSTRRSLARLSFVATIVVALLLAGASSAFAAPDAPTLSFDGLRTLLQSGPVTGYMRTVVNEPISGSDITTINLTVEAVPLSGTAYDDNSLIAFEASSAIAEGMSGSPIYVHTAGGDKLIGAVSYGSEFTIGGAGLATPIEAMAQIETQRGSAVVPLSKPIISSNGVFNKIIVAPNPQDFAGAAAEGAFVARPLATVSLGGLRPTSAGYKALVKDLAARGITPAAQILPLGGTAQQPSFSTEMTGGASIGVWASRGDLWYGGIGTVTYVHGNNVLAFGHPAFFSGTTALDMTNASVEKIWQNSYASFKLADPGALCGAITQDRSKGILGKLNTYATETTITATASDTDNPGTETTSAVYVPRQLFTTGFADSYLAGAAAYMAGSKLFDSSSQAGSAHTTTTVLVRDIHDTEHTITIPNYTDSTDVAWDAANDVMNVVATLQSTLEWGTDKLTIESINLTGEYSAQRKGATIVAVKAPNGLKVGLNRLTIDAVVYGVDETKTIPATLTIPAGTALGGSLSAYAINNTGDDEMSSMLSSMGLMLGVNDSGGRQSIAQLASGLNKTLPNNTVEIEFDPAQTYSGFSEDGPTKPLSTKPVILDLEVPWPATGGAELSVTTINAAADQNPIAYGGWTEISGVVNGQSDNTTVSLYATTAGSSTETLIATTTATTVDGQLAFDFAPEMGFTTNTTFRVHVDGDGGMWSGADATIQLGVKAIASLKTSAARIARGRTVKLTASVFPATSAGGTIVFERQSGKKWIRIATKTLGASGSSAKATYTWKPGRGTQKVRARYLGGTYNYATVTGTRSIVVR